MVVDAHLALPAQCPWALPGAASSGRVNGIAEVEGDAV